MMRYFKQLAAILIMISLCGFGFPDHKLKRKADAGDAASQYELAVQYYRGSKAKDVKPNKKLAVKYYRKAADQGNLDAMMDLGKMAENDKDYKTAISYYEQAANKNHAASQTNLGLLYHNGTGVPKDAQKAEYWYKRGDENGDILAKRNLAVLYDQEKRYSESEPLFKVLLTSKSSRDNSVGFKQAVCLKLMEDESSRKKFDEAYVWGAVAIISGIFDGRVDNARQKLALFEEISSKLSEEKKEALSKEIIAYHYNAFQKYESYLQEHPELQAVDGLIDISGKPLMHMTGYLLAKNKDNYAKVNYFKDKSDEKSKINYAIGNLRIASSHLRLGSISPNYHYARSKISDAKKVLDEYEYENLKLLKTGINMKLAVLNRLVKFIDAMESKTS